MHNIRQKGKRVHTHPKVKRGASLPRILMHAVASTSANLNTRAV